MRLINGALAGFVATIPMTVVMEALRYALPREQARPAPPREVVDRTLDAVSGPDAADDDTRKKLTFVGHFAFGAAAGAVFASAVEPRNASIWKGIAYGVAVWAAAYGFGLPSAGLHRDPARDTPDRNAVLIASHIVWGAALGAGVRQSENVRFLQS
jgi:uncharacterized membrane protein YagU involved in acid resistance